MENGAQSGSGKKPQKKTPARPSSPTRKPAPARKPAARTPAARTAAPAKAAPTPEAVDEVVETPVEVAEETEVVEVVAETPAEPVAEEPETAEEAEPEAEPQPEPEAELEPEAEPEPEAELEPESDVAAEPEKPAFALPKLTVPKISLSTAAIARASRAVADRVKSAATPSEKVDEGDRVDAPEDAVVEALVEETIAEEVVVEEISTEPEPESSPEPDLEPEPAAVEKVPAKKPARRPARKRATEPAVLTVAGLTKRFDDTVAVNAIDLMVPAGAFYGIVGPNGAGKTTTLSMVTGLLRPDEGTVTVHDADVWENPAAAKRNMGVLPDRLRLFDRLTGAQLLYYSGILRGLTSTETKKRTADLAEVFGLEDSLGRLVSDYSSGMTKKVALAAALIHSPRLLVLDEPFESVDPVSAATVTDVLRNYVKQGGTVLLSSHSMDLVERICDNVAIIVGGSVLADGTIAQVRGTGTLEERFVELAGSRTTVEGLEWLHTFSD